MASKTEETPQKEEMREKEGPETLPDDLSDAAIKKLIRSAKKRGYVTHDQINSVLPSEEVNSEQIEDVLAMFREIPVLTWGRDELGAGEMWNSNSAVAWALARTGHDMDTVVPPQGGRAPGWTSGLVLAHRQATVVAPDPDGDAP